MQKRTNISSTFPEYCTGYYGFGFNGKENDNEVKGTGNQQDYGMRIYDPRIGRFLSVDPLFKDYPELTTYQFSSNTPIWAIDIDGLEAWKSSETNDMSKTGFQNFYNTMFTSFNENQKSINVKTDCAKFQFYLLSKYYEFVGQPLKFTGKNGKVFDSNAKDKNGNYLYKDFDSFFKEAKLGISSYYLLNGAGGLTKEKTKGNEVESGDMIINFFPEFGYGHVEGLVNEGDDAYTFYGSGMDNGECPNCRIGSYSISDRVDSYKNAVNRFSWSFLDNIPKDSEIKKLNRKEIKEIPVVNSQPETLTPR